MSTSSPSSSSPSLSASTLDLANEADRPDTLDSTDGFLPTAPFFDTGLLTLPDLVVGIMGGKELIGFFWWTRRENSSHFLVYTGSSPHCTHAM